MHKRATIIISAVLLVCAACTRDQINSDIDEMAGAGVVVAEDPRITAFETQIRALEDRTQAEANQWTLRERLSANGVPGASVAIIENGEIILVRGYGTTSSQADEPVDAQTVFSAGSVSKLINAALILRLVQEGELDLDEDINTYLTSWRVPENEFTDIRKVTLRALLSHTSGFSQHGFPDFQPDEETPTISQTLSGLPPAKHGPVELLFEPGSKMKYSGGGITVSQLIVEEVTGLSYEEAARTYVFEPLGMSRSTFASPLPETHGNIAKAHDRKGRSRALPRGYETMPEIAASGLWTSALDLAIFVKAILRDDDFLSNELRQEMLSRTPLSWHGLGPRLNGAGDKRVFHHGGSNNSYQTWVEGHPAQANGFIVLTNGEGGRTLAYELRIATERAFDWKINFPDDYDEPEFD